MTGLPNDPFTNNDAMERLMQAIEIRSPNDRHLQALQHQLIVAGLAIDYARKTLTQMSADDLKGCAHDVQSIHFEAAELIDLINKRLGKALPVPFLVGGTTPTMLGRLCDN